jgi:hypothetical protein
VAIKSKRFDELIAEAERQPFAGWDFSYVKDRMVEATLPWDYVVEVLERLNGVSALLDLGTGGGEVLSQLAPFPPRTFATEEYAPNAPIAARRLHPLGAQVVRYEAPMENDAAPGVRCAGARPAPRSRPTRPSGLVSFVSSWGLS